MGLLCMRWYHAHAAFVAQSRVVITMSTSARHKHERARSLPRPDKLTGTSQGSSRAFFIINTQDCRHDGSHWISVAISMRRQ